MILEMSQTWWINQTRNYKFERGAGIVAGQIKEDPTKTHYGRANVSRMNEGDLFVSYIRTRDGGIIDLVGRVIKKSPSLPGVKAPWPRSADGVKAYVAQVKYFPIVPAIQKSEYIDKMLEFGYYSKGPITHIGTISQGYAFELRGKRFDYLVGLRNLSQSDFDK